MDPNIGRWVVEMLIDQNNISDKTIDTLLESISPSDSDSYNLKLSKRLLLRCIDSQLTQNRITQDILEYLERIEEIDLSQGAVVLDSMKSAYCAVAVECTMKMFGSKEEFCRAVESIWRNRVRVLIESRMSRLSCCPELRVWMGRMEKAVRGGGAEEGLENWDGSRVESIVRVYLKEARALMGPSFLEGVGKAIMGNGGDIGTFDLVNLFRNMGGEGLSGKGDNVAERELNALGCDGQSVGAVGGSGADKDGSSLNKAQDAGLRDRPVPRDRGIIRRPNVPSKRELVASRRRTKGAKIASVQDSDTYTEQSELDTIPTPKVVKLVEELKSSSLEFQALVKDPLSDALRIADDLVSNLARKNMHNQHIAERMNIGDVCPAELSAHASGETAQIGEADPTRKEVHEAVASIPSGNDKRGNDDAQPVLTKGNATGGQSHSDQTPRRNLERSSSSQTLERDHSIGISPEGPSKPIKLSSPKRPDRSPLKKYENTKLTRRRKINRWSNLEEDTLRKGVQRFGKGHWKMILFAYRNIFEDRTEVDLKDKWRNMTR